jgi:hypothetical protein
VDWRTADAMSLPFPDASFDCVVCQFGVMFFPDRVHAYAEARRVLAPGGVFVFNAWDRIEENDFAHVIAQALAKLFPNDPPRFMERTPHGYHDAALIRRDLAGAGFPEADIDTVAARSVARTALDPAIAYCQGTPWRSEIEARGSLEEATRVATQAIESRFGKGPGGREDPGARGDGPTLAALTAYNARAGSSSSEVSVLPSSRRAAPRSGSQFPSLIVMTRLQGRDSPWKIEKGSENEQRHREVVQRRKGFRIHHA